MPAIQLTQRVALDYVGQREWNKGSDYVSNLKGLTAQPDGETLILRGSAYGQEKYAVRVNLQGGQISDSDCSCPVGTGRCKHVAALLTRAVNDAEAFTELPELQGLLDALDAPELRLLVRRMLEREPSLMRLVVNRPRKKGEPARSDLRQRMQDAFSLLEYDPEEDWEGDGPDLSDLELLMVEADALLVEVDQLKEQARTDLLECYLTVLAECGALENDDYDLGLEVLYIPARTGVLKLLQFPLDEHTRENALDGLQESIGDLGWNQDEFEYNRQNEAFAALPEQERQMLKAFVQQLMQSEKIGYLKKAYAGTLLMLSADQELGYSEELELARATANPVEIITVYLKHGHTQEAVKTLYASNQVAPQHLEALFQQHDLMTELEQFAEAKLNSIYGARQWLYDRYRQTNRTAQAYAIAKNAVVKGTGSQVYSAYYNPQHFRRPDWLSELKSISPNWEADRAEYVNLLRAAPGMTNHLMRFLLNEKQLDTAEEIAHRNSSQYTPTSPELLTELALQLPAERAKPLILQAVLAHVSQRGREHYLRATETLLNAQPLIGKDETRTIAAHLTRDNPTLRALKEELKKAGLV